MSTGRRPHSVKPPASLLRWGRGFSLDSSDRPGGLSPPCRRRLPCPALRPVGAGPSLRGMRRAESRVTKGLPFAIFSSFFLVRTPATEGDDASHHSSRRKKEVVQAQPKLKARPLSPTPVTAWIPGWASVRLSLRKSLRRCSKPGGNPRAVVILPPRDRGTMHACAGPGSPGFANQALQKITTVGHPPGMKMGGWHGPPGPGVTSGARAGHPVACRSACRLLR